MMLGAWQGPHAQWPDCTHAACRASSPLSTPQPSGNARRDRWTPRTTSPLGSRMRSDPGALQTAQSTVAAQLAALKAEFADLADLEYRARQVVDRMALTIQAALLVQHAPAAVADAFCASRLDGMADRQYGTLPRGVDCRFIIDRATPQV